MNILELKNYLNTLSEDDLVNMKIFVNENHFNSYENEAHIDEVNENELIISYWAL